MLPIDNILIILRCVELLQSAEEIVESAAEVIIKFVIHLSLQLSGNSFS